MSSKSVRSRRSNTIVWVLSILLGLVMAVGAVSLVTKQTLLNPAFHRKIIEQQLVVDRLNADLPALFLNIERSGSSTGQLAQVPEDTFGKLLWSVIPADWVAGQVEGLIQKGIDFVESGQETFAVMIDLTSIKQNLEAKTSEMANTVIEGMPTCTSKDILGFMNYVLSGDNSNYPYCMPPKPFDTLVKNAIANSVSFMTQMLPDKITVVTISLDNAELRPLIIVLRIVRIMAQIYRIAAYGILGLLLALILTNLKTLRIAIRSIGYAFIGSGISILLVALGVYLYGKSLNLAGMAGTSSIPFRPELVAGYMNGVFAGVEAMLWKLGAALGGGGAIILLATTQRRQPQSTDQSISVM